MKRLFIAAITVTLTTVTFASSATTTPGTSVTIVRVDEKTPVKLEDLPEAVKKALKGPEFEGWMPVLAYWVKLEKSSFYEIELRKGDEKKIVNLTAEGTRVI